MADKTFQSNVEDMKRVAEMLIPYTFPVVSFDYEQEVLLLKQKTITFDGYELLICFSKADYGDYFLESIQVQSCFAPFLPFAVVCKIGRAFLGQKHISYVDFLKNNKKIYCWTIRSRDGRSLPPEKVTKMGSYEGFNFNILQPGSIDLF